MLKIEKTEVVGWGPAIRGMRNPLESWDKSDSNIGFGNVFCCDCGCKDMEPCGQSCIDVGPNDQDLMTRLRDAGTDHRKFMRFLDVYVDITAPLYWWKEFKTYRAGRVFGDDEPEVLPIPEDYLEFDIEMNSCSTMHKIHSKEFTLDDFSCEHIGDVPNCDPGYYNALETVIAALNEARHCYLDTKDKRYWWQMIQLLPSSYNQKRTLKLNYEVLANMYKSRRNHKLDEWHTFCDWVESLPYSELITGSESKKAAAMGNALSKGLREGIESVQRAVKQMQDTDHSDISGFRVGMIGTSLMALNLAKGRDECEKREETSGNEKDH